MNMAFGIWIWICIKLGLYFQCCSVFKPWFEFALFCFDCAPFLGVCSVFYVCGFLTACAELLGFAYLSLLILLSVMLPFLPPNRYFVIFSLGSRKNSVPVNATKKDKNLLLKLRATEVNFLDFGKILRISQHS